MLAAYIDAEDQQQHRQWVEEALCGEKNLRDSRWSEGLGFGSEGYIDSLKIQLSSRSRYRHKYRTKNAFVLQEEGLSYRIDFIAKKQL
jgi:hypothetical protein